MLKQAVQLEVKKGDRGFQFIFPNDSNLGELHDVLFQMRSFIIEKINEAALADKPQELKEQSKEG